MDILTKSKLVVKRIASGETKQPRIPVTAELLASEVRLVLRPAPRAPGPGPRFRPGAPRLRRRRRPSQMTKYCHLKACASF